MQRSSSSCGVGFQELLLHLRGSAAPTLEVRAQAHALDENLLFDRALEAVVGNLQRINRGK